MYILASKSPRRIELLKTIINDFLIVPANINEKEFPIESLSLEKASKIAQIHPNDTIIGADTFVKYNNKIFNKPVDENEAYEMLKTLSNQTHEVITYFTIINKNKNITYSNHITSYVTFNNLSNGLIEKYINSKSPLDKAGAYGIQDNNKFPIIKEYKGSLNNIIGFPIEEIKIALDKLGL